MLYGSNSRSWVIVYHNVAYNMHYIAILNTTTKFTCMGPRVSLYGHFVVQWSPLQIRQDTNFWLFSLAKGSSSGSAFLFWNREIEISFFVLNFAKLKDSFTWKLNFFISKFADKVSSHWGYIFHWVTHSLWGKCKMTLICFSIQQHLEPLSLLAPEYINRHIIITTSSQ